MAEYDVVVVGSGVGGYVAAIRAAQLGMNTAVVERSELGGTCLNWGCIPSKALLRNAEVVSLLQHADEFGIVFDNVRVDFGKAIDRSRRVVKRLTDGVSFLLKKNNVTVYEGYGALKDASTGGGPAGRRDALGQEHYHRHRRTVPPASEPAHRRQGGDNEPRGARKAGGAQ